MTAVVTLASGSAIRRTILENAGLRFAIERPDVDEAAIKSNMAARGESGESIAQALADAKALEVSARTQGLVIGADQVLRHRGDLYDKAESLAEARDRLSTLAGDAHELVGAVSLAKEDQVIRRHAEVSRLHMRPLDGAEIDRYLERAGADIVSSVGCYQFEGLGAQLFDRVDGDYFAILGLPLLPVLNMLREEGATSI